MRKIRSWRERRERIITQPVSKDAVSCRFQMLVRKQNHKAGSVMKDRKWQNNRVSPVHSVSTADLVFSHKTSFHRLFLDTYGTISPTTKNVTSRLSLLPLVPGYFPFSPWKEPGEET